MAAAKTNAGFVIRDGQSRGDLIGPTVEAVLDGDSFPFIQAVHIGDRWLLMVDASLPGAAGLPYRMPATVSIHADVADVRTWVEMLARLHAKAAA